MPQYYDKNSATYKTRLGEGYFLRAFAYFELVKQFGGVPLKLTPSTSVETYFTRASEEDVYKQIISDFQEAITCCQKAQSRQAVLQNMPLPIF